MEIIILILALAVLFPLVDFFEKRDTPDEWEKRRGGKHFF